MSNIKLPLSPLAQPAPKVSTTRRHLCQSLVAGAALIGPGMLPLRVSADGELDLSREPDLLRALVKMRGNLDSELAIGWLRAKRFSISQGRIEPLCSLIAAAFSRFRRVSDDLYEAVVLEVTHYTDFETWELLDTLRMPFTGREVEVPAFRFGPTRTRFAVNLDESEEFEPQEGTTQGAFSPAASVRMTKSIHPEYVRDGTLLLRHEEHGRVRPTDSDIPNMFYKESTIWSAPLKEVLDPNVKQVDSLVNYSAMTSWRPWMYMGDVPGHTSSNGHGARARSIEDLPNDFLRYTRELHPDVLQDPEAVLDAFAG
ncbi:MAG: DUF1838 domain-containing protein [Gammaproteobacteria bacterium]|nr:DUF1838 domain-containing protein [Gammaproteobacteria bacterium]MYD03311.1 DUF1838 domain-containing protein [Gammaproteobacteria bacterium]MYI24153.1 DUF1838 domain-containing protein [Gammaproteobacteria bacterium]